MVTATQAQSAPVNVGQLIGFEDDGPQCSASRRRPTDPELIQNGSFEAGHGLATNDWEIFSGITGWDQGSNDIPFEVHTNGTAGFSPHSGNSSHRTRW